MASEPEPTEFVAGGFTASSASPDSVDDAAVDDSDEYDPYGIIPDGFVERFPDADTVPEALRAAEKAPSTTDYSAQPRCRHCGSIRIVEKTGWTSSPIRLDAPLKCDGCGSHMAETLPPKDAFAPDEPACPGCGSQLLRRRNPDDVVECVDCGGQFDRAVPIKLIDNPVRAADIPRLPSPDDLRDVRESLELSLCELDGTGSSPSTIASYERGDTSPTLDRVRSMFAFYRVVDAHRRAERLAIAIAEPWVDS